MNALSVAQNLRKSKAKSVNHWDDLRVLLQLSLLLSGYKRPELVDVDDGAPVQVLRQVVMAHTDLTEVTRMVLIEVDSLGGKAQVDIVWLHGEQKGKTETK